MNWIVFVFLYIRLIVVIFSLIDIIFVLNDLWFEYKVIVKIMRDILMINGSVVL